MLEKEKTYTLEEIAKRTRFNAAYIKMLMKSLDIDNTMPIKEQDALRIAKKLKRPWPK